VVLVAPRPPRIHPRKVYPHDHVDGARPGDHGERDGVAADEAGAFFCGV
jgi:hypothetical protein